MFKGRATYGYGEALGGRDLGQSALHRPGLGGYSVQFGQALRRKRQLAYGQVPHTPGPASFIAP